MPPTVLLCNSLTHILKVSQFVEDAQDNALQLQVANLQAASPNENGKGLQQPFQMRQRFMRTSSLFLLLVKS